MNNLSKMECEAYARYYRVATEPCTGQSEKLNSDYATTLSELEDVRELQKKEMEQRGLPVIRSMVYELDKNGGPQKVAEFSLEAKKALICYYKQNVEGNFNTWEYPEMLDGMREGHKDGWYIDDLANDRVIAAYPA